MFLWRLTKRLIFWAGFVGAVYLASGYVNIHGRPARQHAETFLRSELWHEGVKDMRTWLAAILKVAGEKVEEGITEEDRAQLNHVIEADLESQIRALKAPAATPSPTAP